VTERTVTKDGAQRIAVNQAILIGFALWVLNATAPPYRRATFPD
jgi:hypothetical protein